MNFSVITPLECYLLIALGGFFVVQMIYLFVIYFRLATHNKSLAKRRGVYTEKFDPISVILTTKDSAQWLREHLPTLLTQDYPEYEVIVINDASVDETDDVLKLLESEYPHLYHTFTPDTSRYVSRKKLSLTLGIRAAKYDWLVFTEQGCFPEGDQWLRQMARNFTPETDIVLGYSNFQKVKGWFNLQTTYDRLVTQVRFLAAAALRLPYMGLGANMAYRKQLWYDNKGYSKYLNMQRGEDDLFVNQTADRHNTRVELSCEGIVRMDSDLTRKLWREEKVMHVATAHKFIGCHQWLWHIDTATRYIFLVGCLALIAHAVYYMHALIGIAAIVAWLLYYLIYIVAFRQVTKALGEQSFIFSLPIFHILQPLWDFNFRLSWLFRSKRDFLRK